MGLGKTVEIIALVLGNPSPLLQGAGLSCGKEKLITATPWCERGHTMKATNKCNGAYKSTGWLCDKCGAAGTSKRWCCFICSSDYCFSCVADATGTDAAIEDDGSGGGKGTNEAHPHSRDNKGEVKGEDEVGGSTLTAEGVNTVVMGSPNTNSARKRLKSKKREAAPSAKSFYGKTICFLGKYRAETKRLLEAKAEMLGATVTNSVTRRTRFIITAPGVDPSKEVSTAV